MNGTAIVIRTAAVTLITALGTENRETDEQKNTNEDERLASPDGHDNGTVAGRRHRHC